MSAPAGGGSRPATGDPAAGLATGRAIGWAVATVAGLAAAGFVFHFPGSLGGTTDPAALVFGTLLGGVSGLAVGLLQAMPLHGAVPRLGRQVWATGAIVGGTHGVHDGVRDFGPLLQVGVGLVAAGVAWTLLGERRIRVLAGVAVGWAVGLLVAGWTTNALGMPWEETPVGWSMAHLVSGALTGAIFAAAVTVAGFPGTVAAHLAGGRPGAPAQATTRPERA